MPRDRLSTSSCFAPGSLRRLATLLVLALATSACVGRGGASGAVRAPAARAANKPSGAPRAPLAWAPFDASTFARAKAERRYVLLDGSAEWCHFCHVMEAETYHDPEVASLLRERFIASKVDIDQRPDIQERYEAWGWPATVVFSPDGEELGKYRGYLPPAELLTILRAVLEGDATTGAASSLPQSPPMPKTAEARSVIQRFTALELEEYWDDDQGGWGLQPKVPLFGNVAWALERGNGRDGDPRLRDHARVALAQERKIMDPIWGGIYQYSVAADWDHPHFEKLMVWNAGALDNYARAYALSGDPRALATARAIQGYLETFLLARDGAFHGSQDADLNAHDRTRPFVDGHVYYALGDGERRALGVPRVDPHEYAVDSGLAVAAYATLFEATHDAAVRSTAERAVATILATHLTERGGVAHEATPDARVLFLSDNAAFGWGLVRLYEATSDARLLIPAGRLADFLLRDLQDPAGGGFFAHTKDDAAVGVFAKRRKPFDDNTLALRFLAKLAHVLRARHEADPGYETAALRALDAVSTPEQIKAQGKFLGSYLLALDETRDLGSSREVTAPTAHIK